MKIPRRTFLHLAASAAVLPALTRIASAQSFPTDCVRGFASGSCPPRDPMYPQTNSPRLARTMPGNPCRTSTSNNSATTSATPGPDEFTIGPSANATAANLQSALTASLGKLANTSLAVFAGRCPSPSRSRLLAGVFRPKSWLLIKNPPVSNGNRLDKTFVPALCEYVERRLGFLAAA